MSSDSIKTYVDGGIYNLLSYGSPGISKGVRFARYMSQFMKKGQKTVNIGCGNGYEVIQLLNDGMDAYGTEIHDIDVPVLKKRIINAIVPNLPFKDKEFDLLMCTEVIEHIPEIETEDFINECCRVADKCFFSIATRGDEPYNSHINVHGPQWWLDKLEEINFRVINFQFKPFVEIRFNNLAHFRSGYSDGIAFYGDKNLQDCKAG